jgi:hypothetical protein
MSTSLLKKKSVVAVAAVLGISAMAGAATIYGPQSSPYTGYTNQDGSNTASLTAGTLALAGTGTTGSPVFADFGNTAAVPTGTGFTLSPGTTYTISFNMDTNIKGANTTGVTNNPQVGVEAVDSNGNIVAGLFSQYGPDNLPDLVVSDGKNNNVAAPGFATAADGVNGASTLTLDPSNNTFFATYGGQTYAGTLYDPINDSIAFVSLAGVDQGVAGSAGFSNFTITTAVPEPASMAMIGLGGVMLLAKRRRRPI